MWTQHLSVLSGDIGSHWCVHVQERQSILAQKLKRLKKRLEAWNREVHGHLKSSIGTAEQQVFQSLRNFDLALSNQDFEDLKAAEVSLRDWLKDEETHWK